MYITNQDLFQFSIVIISVITLVVTVIKKKQPPKRPNFSGYSLTLIFEGSRLSVAFLPFIILLFKYFVNSLVFLGNNIASERGTWGAPQKNKSNQPERWEYLIR